MGAQVEGVGVRAWNSFSSATRACLYSCCFEAYRHIYPGPSYFFAGKRGSFFFFFFYFTKSSCPLSFPPYPTPFHHKKSNGRSLIASKQGLFLTQRAYDIYTTSFALTSMQYHGIASLMRYCLNG